MPGTSWKSSSPSLEILIMPTKNSPLRFKAVAEADPSTLVRILHLLQARNVVPQRVSSQRLGLEYLELEVEVPSEELSADAFRLIVAKVNELAIVLTAVEIS